MLIALLLGTVIGFVLAMPPGPVAVATMKVGMDKGLKQSVLLALGNGVMDFSYCTIAIFATSAAIYSMDSFSKAHPFLMLIFQLTVVAGIIIYGVINIRTKDKELIPTEIQKRGILGRIYDYLSHKGPFLLGISVALMNIANPTFLPVLAALTAKIQTSGLMPTSAIDLLSFAIGFGFGNFFWLYLLAKFISIYKDSMSSTTIARIKKFSGLTLLGVGTYLGYHILVITKWSEILISSKIYDVLRFILAI